MDYQQFKEYTRRYERLNTIVKDFIAEVGTEEVKIDVNEDSFYPSRFPSSDRPYCTLRFMEFTKEFFDNYGYPQGVSSGFLYYIHKQSCEVDIFLYIESVKPWPELS
jgi:hypothetical protein